MGVCLHAGLLFTCAVDRRNIQYNQSGANKVRKESSVKITVYESKSSGIKCVCPQECGRVSECTISLVDVFLHLMALYVITRWVVVVVGLWFLRHWPSIVA